MDKWYKCKETSDGVIISSRIRLARNIKKYSFSSAIKKEDAEKVISESRNVIENAEVLEDKYSYMDLQTLSEIEKRKLMEKHIISPYLVKNGDRAGVILREDESVSVMLNEEDHIRIQAIRAGNNLKSAYEEADKMDDLMEDKIEYAFDKDFGYLTSCPTNIGTGMRASFMVHLPYLEKIGHLKNLIQTLGKFGVAVRGIYGEGTEPSGSIYQISNQRTLGKSEQEIMDTLQNITVQIIEKERNMVIKKLETERVVMEDSVYRAYGILTNCRLLTMKEAMSRLSEIRFGYMYDLLKEKKPIHNIYHIMMNIQFGNLQTYAQKELEEGERDEIRAEYLRKCFEV